MKKFSFSDVKTVKVSELKMSEFFIKYGLDKLDQGYLRELMYFGHYEIPLVTKDNAVLSHCQDVLAARHLGKDTISVVEISTADGTEMSQGDILRLINFKNYCGNTRDYSTAYNMLVEIEKALKNNEAWVADVPGDKKEKQAKLMGYSEGQVQNILAIGNSKPELFEEIKKENGMSLRDAVLEVKFPTKDRKTNDETGKKSKNRLSSDDAKDRTIPPNLKSFEIEIGTNLYAFSVIDGVAAALKNGKKLTDFSFDYINALDNAETKKQGKNVIGETRYIFQVEGIKKSIHIILNNPTEFKN